MVFDTRDWVTTNLEVSNDRGDEIFARCPQCKVMDGRFAVNPDSGFFRCFRGSCGYVGHVTRLVKDVEGLSWSEAHKRVGGQQERLTRHGRMQREHRQAQSLEFDIPLPEDFIPCYESGRDPEWRVIKYIREREIADDVLKDWGVGFCKDGDYFNRAVIPVESPGVKAFTSRDATDDWMETEKFKRPKYKNPAGKWAKMALLGWSFYEAGQDLVLCEGPFDVLRLASHGIPALSLLGKVISPQQRALLYKLPKTTNITLMIDPGEKKRVFDEAAAGLAMKFKNLFVAKLPSLTDPETGATIQIDPGECTEDQALEAIDNAKRWTGVLK